MKAGVIYENGDPDVLRYEDVPDPECPDGCVVIEVEAISIEGGDLLARAGSPPPSIPTSSGTSPRGRWSRSAPASRTAPSATGS
jgi:NADPH:quinone reductase